MPLGIVDWTEPLSPLEKADMKRERETLAAMEKRIAKLEAALGNFVRFDRGDTAIARGDYNNLIVEACEALGGDWKS